MICLYIGKVQDDYFIMYSSRGYDFKVPSSNYGLVCTLNDKFEHLADVFFCNAKDIVNIDTLILGCKKLKKHELDYHLNKKLNDYLGEFNAFEVNTWEMQRLEVEKYLDSNGSYTSSILDNIAQAKNIEVKVLINSIIEKSCAHQAHLLEFKICKDRISTNLETLNTLEQLEAFDVIEELNKQLGITLKSDEEESVASQEDLNLLPSIPSDKSFKVAVLDSTDASPKDPTEQENNELILEPLDNLKKASIAENESLEQEEKETSKTIKKRQSKYIQASSKPTRQN